jgi:hypothetical protein
MIRVIDIDPSKSNQIFTVTLDGETFEVRLLWNARAGGWFLSLLDAEGTRIATGRKVTTDHPLLLRDTLPGMPAGYLWLVDMTGRGEEAGLRDLGRRHRLAYIEGESLS